MSKELTNGTTVPEIAYSLVLEYKNKTQNTDWALMFSPDKRVSEMNREEFLRAYNAAHEYFKTMI